MYGVYICICIHIYIERERERELAHSTWHLHTLKDPRNHDFWNDADVAPLRVLLPVIGGTWGLLEANHVGACLGSSIRYVSSKIRIRTTRPEFRPAF